MPSAAIGPPAVPALLKAAESSPDPPVRILAHLAARAGRSMQTARGCAALKDPEKDVRPRPPSRWPVWATGRCRRCGRRCGRRTRAALALGNRAAGRQRGRPGTGRREEDEDKELRVAADHAIVQIDAPAAPALAEGRVRRPERWYSISVCSARSAPPRPAAEPALTTGLNHEEKGVRILAANALAKIDPDNPRSSRCWPRRCRR